LVVSKGFGKARRNWKVYCTYLQGKVVSSVDWVVPIFAAIMMVSTVPRRLLRRWIGEATSKTFFQQLNESSRMGWPPKTWSSQQTFSRVYTLLAKTLFCTVGFRSFDVMPAEKRCQFWCVSDSIRASQM
jgi:hypothetical protein